VADLLNPIRASQALRSTRVRLAMYPFDRAAETPRVIESAIRCSALNHLYIILPFATIFATEPPTHWPSTSRSAADWYRDQLQRLPHSPVVVCGSNLRPCSNVLRAYANIAASLVLITSPQTNARFAPSWTRPLPAAGRARRWGQLWVILVFPTRLRLRAQSWSQSAKTEVPLLSSRRSLARTALAHLSVLQVRPHHK